MKLEGTGERNFNRNNPTERANSSEANVKNVLVFEDFELKRLAIKNIIIDKTQKLKMIWTISPLTLKAISVEKTAINIKERAPFKLFKKLNINKYTKNLIH